MQDAGSNGKQKYSHIVNFDDRCITKMRRYIRYSEHQPFMATRCALQAAAALDFEATCYEKLALGNRVSKS